MVLQAVQVKKVLHDTLALRSRCSRVVLICEVDESDESKSNRTIPALEGICAPIRRRSAPSTIQPWSVSSFLVNGICTTYRFISSLELEGYAQDGRQLVRFLLPFYVGVYLVMSSLKITPYEWERIDRCVSRHSFCPYAYPSLITRLDIAIEGAEHQG